MGWKNEQAAFQPSDSGLFKGLRSGGFLSRTVKNSTQKNVPTIHHPETASATKSQFAACTSFFFIVAPASLGILHLK